MGTLIVNAIPQGHVQTVVAATLCSHFIHVTCAREEVVSIFVEGHRHDPVGEVEGLLHAVTVVDVNVNVEHPGVVPGVRAKPGSGVGANPQTHSA